MKLPLLIWILATALKGLPLQAQSVVYSPTVGNGATTRFDAAGRSGSFYWIHKNRLGGPRKAPAASTGARDFSFEVYDARLHLVKVIPFPVTDTVRKQYLVAGQQAFDQLLIQKLPQQTRVVLNRFSPEGTVLAYGRTLRDFPPHMEANDLLLVRSQDGQRLLLLGFEPVEGAPPRVHALLYNSNWDLLAQTVHRSGSLAQPFVQYEFTHYPLEHFDNSPVKLANNGDWVMVAPSRRGNHYALFHFRLADSSFTQHDLRLTEIQRVQHVSLSLDNEQGTAHAGLLLQTAAPAVKRVRVAQYGLAQGKLALDTAFRFNTLAPDQKRNENIFEQYFVPVPGRGFLFLKEYGRPFISLYVTAAAPEAEEAPAFSTVNPIPAAFNKNDYTRYPALSGVRREYDRGDLSLYYFPATPGDSTWSGIINQAQTGELNAAYLSYACLPLESRIVFLYNQLTRNQNRFSSSTVVDEKGYVLEEGPVFWRPGHVLRFQQARQIGSRELAVPYEKNRMQGFAIIRL